MFAGTSSNILPPAPVTLLSSIITKYGGEPHPKTISMLLLDLMRHTHEKILEFEAAMNNGITPIRKQSARANVLKDSSNISSIFSYLHTNEDCKSNLHTACAYASSIHLKSLGRFIPFSSMENQSLVQQLRLSLELPDAISWHQRYPDIYLWLCITGVVATQEEKPWFLAKAGTVIMSLKGNELQVFKSTISRFCRLLEFLEGSSFTNVQ